MATRFRRRALSMTSLIDVIFLLLMFFMLSTRFTRTAELPLTAAGAAEGVVADAKLLFLRLAPGGITLNGRAVTMEALADRLRAEGGTEPQVLVSFSDDTTSQALADILVALRRAEGVRVQVLG